MVDVLACARRFRLVTIMIETDPDGDMTEELLDAALDAVIEDLFKALSPTEKSEEFQVSGTGPAVRGTGESFSQICDVCLHGVSHGTCLNCGTSLVAGCGG